MRTVYKYPIPVRDEIILDLPAGAEVIHVDQQDEQTMLWALVDPDAPKVFRRFRLAETGHPLGDDDVLHHVGSYMLMNGALVFHLFEAVKP